MLHTAGSVYLRSCFENFSPNECFLLHFSCVVYVQPEYEKACSRFGISANPACAVHLRDQCLVEKIQDMQRTEPKHQNKGRTLASDRSKKRNKKTKQEIGRRIGI